MIFIFLLLQKFYKKKKIIEVDITLLLEKFCYEIEEFNLIIWIPEKRTCTQNPKMHMGLLCPFFIMCLAVLIAAILIVPANSPLALPCAHRHVSKKKDTIMKFEIFLRIKASICAYY
ncbi:hypothetical protein BpHYR1_024632 [Brachionus plicatilis]|uniref:Uncharacterized protein n=1 Tax=Brachionus plicatilis TaxID=10195 RepID=A0A3M7SGL3_BRAPC|nr:hypothetical protein BpHYR1_024632 [Brachionus plicatilis]